MKKRITNWHPIVEARYPICEVVRKMYVTVVRTTNNEQRYQRLALISKKYNIFAVSELSIQPGRH